MKTPPRFLLGCALLCVLLAPALGQRRRDPLNPLEIGQLRETALEPDLRLKLLVKFARARLTSLDQARSDPKVTDGARQTHDLLSDFLDIYDELNDNLDMYVDRQADIRKPLKAVIEADVEFQAKLRALKDSSSKEEARQYQFVLANAMLAVDESAQDHRKLMSDQEEATRRRKK